MHWLVYAIVFISVMLIDQMSKKHAINSGKKIVKNKGAFLGFLKHKPKLLLFCQFLAIGVLIYLFFSDNIFIQRLMFALMIGGAVSNEYEHIKKDGVTDFIKVGKLYVNMADLAIFTGLFGFTIYSIISLFIF
ncbi:MAG: signal peptidase II [Clostridiales bacterium]|nr:signal peptidase II [Clostridiales bacterium]